MDNYKIYCKIDNKEVEVKTFINYLKSKHNISLKDYINKYEKKFDFYDKSAIKFKSLEQYLLSDFNNRKNLKLWLKSKSVEERRDYIFNKYKNYILLKNIENALPEAIISTVNCLLPISYIEESINMNFDEICEILSLKSLFKYNEKFLKSLKFNKVSNLIVDTREQKPFVFDSCVNVTNKKLEFGDYASLEDPSVSIERKSASDFINTLSKGFIRFQNEIKRSLDLDGYLIVVVESTLNDILYKKNFFGKASGEFIAHRMRVLNKDFNNLQFVFAKNKEEATKYSLKILSLEKDKLKNLDLQYYFNKYEFNNR